MHPTSYSLRGGVTEWVRLPKVTEDCRIGRVEKQALRGGRRGPGPSRTLTAPRPFCGPAPRPSQGAGVGQKGAPLPPAGEGHGCGPPRFADQHGARAAFTLSFLASSALYLLLAAACIRALPGVALLFASRLPGALMHTLPGRAPSATCPSCRGPGLDGGGRGRGAGLVWAWPEPGEGQTPPSGALDADGGVMYGVGCASTGLSRGGGEHAA